MLRVKWLLPLLLLFICTTAKAQSTVSPIIQRCTQVQRNISATASLTCVLTNVTSGNWLTLYSYAIYGTTLSITSATESFTCPGNSSAQDAGIRRIFGCRVQLASSHSLFSVTVTATGAPPVGGPVQVDSLIVKELQGLSTADTGADKAVMTPTDGSNPSVSVPTASNNEWIDSGCTDFADPSTALPDAAFIQDAYTYNLQATDFVAIGQHKVVAVAGSTTVGCTFSGSGAKGLSTMAFQISSLPTSSINIAQGCSYQATNVTVGPNCVLHNTGAGSKMVWGFGMFNPTGSLLCQATESCTCEATGTAVYSAGTFRWGICWADFASSHSTTNLSQNYTGTGNIVFMIGYEITGLPTGRDAGSASACAATTCAYTTAANNEFTFMIAADTIGNQMVAGNSFTNFHYLNSVVYADLGEDISAWKMTTSAGANTGSYTQSAGGTTPAIAILAFGPSTSGRSRVYIIKWSPRHRIPWDRPRRQILLEKVLI